MTTIEYFKRQAKNLFRDYKTKAPSFDEVSGDFLYEYMPKFFDIDALFFDYEVDEDNFSLMKAQHVIAQLAGFGKWAELAKASDAELELAKLLFDNQDKIYREDWDDYITGIFIENDLIDDVETRLEIFKAVVPNWDAANNLFPDYRLKESRAPNKQ